jgi:hypothetical protein
MTKKLTEQFVPRPRSMLESRGYRALSLSAHRVLARIEVEHLKHGGKDNGRLPVTHRDFLEYGVRPNSVASAIHELTSWRFVRIMKKGRSGKNSTPTEYLLTYVHTNNRPPSNDYKRYAGITNETVAKRVTKRWQLGSEAQQNPTNETVANKPNETVALSRETSSTDTALPDDRHGPAGDAAPDADAA